MPRLSRSERILIILAALALAALIVMPCVLLAGEAVS